jgi:hypothetical protein
MSMKEQGIIPPLVLVIKARLLHAHKWLCLLLGLGMQWDGCLLGVGLVVGVLVGVGRDERVIKKLMHWKSTLLFVIQAPGNHGITN